MQVIDYYARPISAIYGGINSTRRELLKAFQNYSENNLIVIDAAGGFQSERIPGISYLNLEHYFNKHALMIPRGIVKYLKKTNFVILHEGWNLGNLYVAFLCRKLKVPYFVVPHGVYDPKIVNSLRLKRIRKIFESFLLNGASFVNVFFESERSHISNIAMDANIVVAPTGASELWTRFKWTGNGDYVYFAGRLDVHHKGLDILIRAWAEIETSVSLVLQGQDFFGGAKKLEKLISELDLTGKVILLPHVSHEEVMLKVANCVFFAHISRWESFGRSLVDAVSVGTPCLVSTQMNIAGEPGAKNVMEIVPLEHLKVVEGIKKLLGEDKSELKKIEKIEWIKDNFNWERTISILQARMR